MCTQGLSTETTQTLKCCLASISLSRPSMCTWVSHTFTSTQKTLRKDCIIITTSHFPSFTLPITHNFIQTLTHKLHIDHAHTDRHTMIYTVTLTHTHTHTQTKIETYPVGSTSQRHRFWELFSIIIENPPPWKDKFKMWGLEYLGFELFFVIERLEDLWVSLCEWICALWVALATSVGIWWRDVFYVGQGEHVRCACVHIFCKIIHNILT